LKRRIALAVLPGVAALALVWWQLSDDGVDWASVLAVPWWSYGLVVSMIATKWISASLRLQLVARVHLIRLPLAAALRAHVLGAFAANVTPSSTGHGLVMAYTLRNSGLSTATSTGVVVFLGAFELIFFAVGGVLALVVFLARRVDMDLASVEIAVGVFGLLGLLAAVLLLRNPDRLIRFATTRLAGIAPLRWRRPLLRFTGEFARAIRESAAAPWWWYAAAGGLTASMWLAHYVLLNSLAAGFGFPFHWLEWLAAQHLMQLVSVVVPTPGGAGFFELALPFLTGGTIPGAVRLPLILVWRLATYYLYLVVGSVAGGSVIGDLLVPGGRARERDAG
jgi:uncharacterized protein (TIRG00374 family)